MMTLCKDDLGLSLSLGTSTSTPTTTTNTNNNGFFLNRHQTTPSQTSTPTPTPLQLNLMMTSPSSLQKLPWAHLSNDRPAFLRGIDVNRPAATTTTAAGGGGLEEEDGGVSSPNSTVSTVSGKRSSAERDSSSGGGATAGGDDVEVERRGGSSDEEEDGGDNSRKKLRLTKDQSAVLEESFKEHNTLNPKQKLALAKRLGLRPRQVEVWFQNRRARTKLKQTEVDCEFLKRCCEQLTEENRRLQKEVQELRALKLSPQFYMQMTPPTTLTMCPSCERVAAPPSGTASAATPHHRPMPANPWVTSPVPIRPFEAIQPRS